MMVINSLFSYKSVLNLGVVLFMLPSLLWAQSGQIQGKVKNEKGEQMPFTTVLLKGTDFATQASDNGEYKLEKVPYGTYTIVFQFVGYASSEKQIKLDQPKLVVNQKMQPKTETLDGYNFKAKKEGVGVMKRMRPIEGVLISEGKKNEVIQLSELNANKTTNQGRQIYSRIPGLNIWESDGAGLQLGIGGRGLNPSRTSNFNTRQNGYDISADALGYPESYYTPPSEAIKEIQFIRGAASLQFGTQFGGLLNFKLHDGPVEKDFELTQRLSVASFNVFNSFTGVGFKKGTWKGYVFFNYKQGNEFRPNSGFDVYTGGLNITKYITEKTSVNVEFTRMHYLAQQPGGLTDFEFYDDPNQSKRERNWFEVDWNLYAASITHEFSSTKKLKSQFFGLTASRKALGILGNISRTDDNNSERDLLIGEFQNFGNETRFLNIYNVGESQWAYVIGGRFYKGYSRGRQGLGDTTALANFEYINPENLEGSDYEFPSSNYALFAEHIFRFGKHFSVTPGVRFEHINTNAEGSYRQIVYDLAQNPIFDTTFFENRSSKRSFVIGGIGMNYRFSDTLEIYTNFTQNYRSINFTDMQVRNNNFRIDPDLQDETGYNFDLGIRGVISNKFSYDVSGFVLLYDNRIGAIDQVDSATFIPYRLRTNVAQATVMGVEATAELDWWKVLVSDSSDLTLSTFVNASYINARYSASENPALNDKLVEFVPPFNLKTGITVGYKNFSASFQYSYVQEHYSDATNAGKAADGTLIFVPSAIIGTIPSYSVMDLSLKYRFKLLTLETGVNNLTDESYFTRRATGYPGPGIIPSPPRNFYVALQLKI